MADPETATQSNAKVFLFALVATVVLAGGAILVTSLGNNNPYQPVETATGSQNSDVAGLEDQQQDVRVVITEAGGDSTSYTLEYQEGESALETLQRLNNNPDRDFSFGTEEFSFGVFVTEFNGVKASDSQFWEFKVNGEPSSVGTADYVVARGDELEFVLSDLQ